MKLLQPKIKLQLLKATRENDVFWNYSLNTGFSGENMEVKSTWTRFKRLTEMWTPNFKSSKKKKNSPFMSRCKTDSQINKDQKNISPHLFFLQFFFR